MVKNKVTILAFVACVAFCGLYLMVTPRISGLWNCWGNQIELGRDTKFSFMFNSCVIDSGRIDSKGNIIWVRAENDRGF